MRVLVLTGPTGAGKTAVGIALALRFGLEIVSADSRQVYIGLDIGTAKPEPDLRQKVKFHMIDVVEPTAEYSAADYARDASAVMERLEREGRRFIVVGGAGFYLRALFRPFFETSRTDPEVRRRLESEATPVLYQRLQESDPERAAQLHPNDRQRIIRALEIELATGRTFSEWTKTVHPQSRFEPVYVVLTRPRPLLWQAINRRFDEMMAGGLLEEVRRLKEQGLGAESQVGKSYGYAELLEFLDGRVTLEEAVSRAKMKTRAYAKRQLTWFRSLKDAVWIECAEPDEAVTRVEAVLSQVLSMRPI
ncbi:MAG: tRNA (adenosine(37)-N6)-dimethylallyltransferase MiaA [candidate division WOR-3 bacterium]